MGLSASQARFLQLTSRKSDIEYNGQQVNQQRTILAASTTQIATQMAQLLQTLDPATTDVLSNVTYQALTSQENQIHSQDQVLEMQLKDIDTQHNAVQTEIDSVKKVIDKNIDSTFKTFA